MKRGQHIAVKTGRDVLVIRLEAEDTGTLVARCYSDPEAARVLNALANDHDREDDQ